MTSHVERGNDHLHGTIQKVEFTSSASSMAKSIVSLKRIPEIFSIKDEGEKNIYIFAAGTLIDGHRQVAVCLAIL